MSGDVQPRKRKDRRRKKDESHDLPDIKPRRSSLDEERDESPPRSSNDRGENIHVHHDHGIGGGVIVKVIFFALLAILLGLVGAIFIESRGSTDVDLPTIEESRFAEYFTGWLDDAADDHGHDEHDGGHEAASGEEEHDEHDDAHEDHDEEEAAHSEEADEEEAHSEEPEESAPATEEQVDEDEPEPEEDDSAVQNDSNEEEEEDDDEVEEEEEEDDVEENDEDNENSEGNDDENSGENDDDIDDADDDEEGSEEDEEDDFDLTQEDDDDDDEEDKPLTKSIAKEEKADSGVEVSEETDNDNDDEDENQSDDEEKEEENDDDEDEKNDDDENESEEGAHEELVEDSDAVEEIEESEEALKEEEEAVKKETLNILVEEEDIEAISDVRRRKFKERQLMRKLEKLLKEQEKAEEDGEGKEDDDAEREETGGVAMKLGVGVALVIVAHMVIVRRWQDLSHVDASDDPGEGEPEGDKNEEETEKKDEVTEPVVSRRQTLVPESARFPNDELDEEYSEEEEIVQPLKRRSSQDVKLERQDPKKYYTKEELGDSEDLEDEEELGEEEYEYEEELEEEEYLEEEEEYDPEGSQTPSDLEPEEEEEDEYEPSPVTQRTPVAPPRRRGSQEVDDEEFLNVSEGTEEPVAAEADELIVPDEPEEEEDISQPKKIDRDDEWLFNQDLDFADDQFNLNPQVALDAYDKVLAKKPTVTRALIGRAKALDKLAEIRRSNPLLFQAIEAYQTVLTKFGDKLDDKTFRELVARTTDRMQFSGRNILAAELHRLASKRFPNEVSHPNAMAVSFLLSGENKKAQKVLKETLLKWPNDGFAQVHLGFILKTDGFLLESIEYLEKGLRSNQTGTMDGRFLFHLGDALQRLGRPQEAVYWYDLGVERGIFKSRYQRSLYNVDRLKGQPWWKKEETTYEAFFKNLESNWKKIREEGMTLLRARDSKLFQDEAESLRDTGDWKQLDLFARGRKQKGCARAPYTCQLISSFGPASSCTRGQAKFSVMEPGTHVWPHCGPTNCRLRAHLGLVVPDGVFLRVAEETRSWEEGKVFIFDDSFEHEVWHNGSSLRLVLIVDVWHPELTIKERQTLSPI